MPKILQRTLLTSIINYIIFVFFYYISFTIINIITENNLDIQKENIMCLLIIFTELYDNYMPDYMFIAPFSKSGRINLQKKLFFYNLFAKWIITSVFIILPQIITIPVINSFHNLVRYILEIIVIYLLLFIIGHLRYIYLINKINFIFTGIFMYIFILPAVSSIFFLITKYTSYYILMVVIAIVIAAISLYYYKKHFKNMLEFYSDYELITQIKYPAAGQQDI